MRSGSLSARMALELERQRAKSSASTILDLPLPLGPVTVTKSFFRGTRTLLPKDLKFLSSTSLMYKGYLHRPATAAQFSLSLSDAPTPLIPSIPVFFSDIGDIFPLKAVESFILIRSFSASRRSRLF